MNSEMDGDNIQLLYETYPKYKEALGLINANGSASEAEQKRQQARQMLTRILTELTSNSSKNALWIAVIKSAIGCILINSEETNDGERIIVESISILEQYRHVTCLQLIQSLNTLAVVRYQQGDVDTAKSYLERADSLCHEYAHEGQPDHDRKEIDRCNTETVFLLAQIYSQSSESRKAAFYCHKTLQQQILLRDATTDFDAFEWAVNCTKLSAFYANNNRFRQARYCIDVTLSILPQGQTERDQFAKADINCASAEVYARWLHLSSDLYQNKQSEASHLDNTIDKFASVSVQAPACFRIAQSLKDAQAIFREGFVELQAALKVYTLDGFVTDHVVLLQKASGLLKDLIIFCSDYSHICKLHKRRIDLLEPVISKLNPKIYNEFVCQLLYEVAQVYSDMAESKLEQMNQESTDEKADRSKKINFLTAKSIQYFNHFMESLRENGSNAIEAGYLHNFLKAKFQVARLHSRFLHSDKESQINALKSSLYEYEVIVSLCKKKTVDEFKEESLICKEMCSLLPLKIQSLLASA